MKQIRIFCMIVMLFFCTNIKANNILISNITSVTGSGFVQLQFDLSWENSWRNSSNYDAAWVFFKFKDNDGTWQPLNLTGLNNVSVAGFTINVPADLTGAMIYRSSTGSGNVSLVSMKVGVNNLPGSFDISSFAIEMVQLPLNVTYYLGDGESGTYYSAGATTNPFLVNSSIITMGNLAGNLFDGIANGTLATGFPVGYNASGSLYMMKHEISQGAYRDFLNTLTYTQQVTRTIVAPNSGTGTAAIGLASRRNGLEIKTPGVNATTPAVFGCDLSGNNVYDEAADGEWIACNYLTYMDLAAFLDWAALRPMTEMEFEKSCRGPLAAVSAENAAGTVAAAAYTYPVSNSGAANESVTAYSGSVFNANINYNSTSPGGNSPLRVGIHATPFATRISAGAGFYGCLDLSGNIEEFTVTSCNLAGRSFTGSSGNGTLTASGDADEDFWPGINGNSSPATANLVYGGVTGVTGQGGVITRGGSCAYTGNNLNKVSYRINPSSPTNYSRSGVSGGRGVKSF